MAEFQVRTSELRLATGAEMQTMDITGSVGEHLRDSGLAEGTLTAFVPGATGALTTIEFEPGLEEDLHNFFETIIPSSEEYRHNLRWGDGNGHSHLRASLLGPSLSVPFTGGKLCLGTWQQIVFVDFDVPARERKIVLQFMGV
jgi:secondary thiamine-phosphate synthase enzyme